MTNTSDRESSSSLLFKEKRKWQIALRRYVVEKQKSPAYAPFFGADIDTFRGWIELQFTNDMNWENFGPKWQLDHIIPVIYFDFNELADLQLCWNFINIRATPVKPVHDHPVGLDILAAAGYFERLFTLTGYEPCNLMVKRVERIGRIQPAELDDQAAFIAKHLSYLNALRSFEAHEYERLNDGMPFEDLQMEKSMLAKFGK